LLAGHTQEQEGGTPPERFQEGEGARTQPELEEVGFQDAEEMEKVEVGPSFSTHSGDRTNMRNHQEVERPHPTSKPLPP